MTILFETPGLIDLRALRTFGVSAKEHEGAIGQFGTGLKYAIAVALRTGCTIEMWRGAEHYRFGTLRTDIRNKEFGVVTLTHIGEDGLNENVSELAFTTDLGKHWQPWMAFRELESNTRDEHGASRLESDRFAVPERHDRTLIAVWGMDECWHNRKDTFLESRLLWKGEYVELHEGPLTTSLFVKGVRAFDLPASCSFRYNLLDAQLTEDRTIKNVSLATYYIANDLLNCDQLPIVRAILRNVQTDFAEKEGFNWPYDPSLNDTWKAAFRELDILQVNDLPPRFKQYYRSLVPVPERTPVEPTEREQLILQRAAGFLQRAGLYEPKYPVRVMESMGTAWGLADRTDMSIGISRHAFSKGLKFIISTLLEEYLHLDASLDDHTDAMQTHLFDMIVTQAELRLGEVL